MFESGLTTSYPIPAIWIERRDAFHCGHMLRATIAASMEKHRKARLVEHVLFVMLLAALGAAGFFYERFQTEVPGWQLVGMIIAGMCASYGTYRLTLNFALRKLKS